MSGRMSSHMCMDMRWVCVARRWKALAEADIHEYQYVYNPPALGAVSAMADGPVVCVSAMADGPEACRSSDTRWAAVSRRC